MPDRETAYIRIGTRAGILRCGDCGHHCEQIGPGRGPLLGSAYEYHRIVALPKTSKHCCSGIARSGHETSRLAAMNTKIKLAEQRSFELSRRRFLRGLGA